MNNRSSGNKKKAEPSAHAQLIELTRIHTDRSLPLPLRIRRFIADVRDPYHFTVNGTDVKIRFSGSNSINTRLACALSAVAETAAPNLLSSTADSTVA